MGERLSFTQLVHGITDFIEVAVHTILYVRQVYPADLFVRRKKYETAVFQSRHPALNDYISGAAKAVRDELMHDHVDKVVIVLKDSNQVPLERFIFSFETLIKTEAFNKDIGVEDAMTPATLVYYFRAFLVKLTMLETTLGPLRRQDDISFAIVLELKDNAVPSITEGKNPPPWIPAVSQDTSAGASKNAELLMIRAVNTGIINLSLAVQESGEKVEREKKERAAKKALEKMKKAASDEAADKPVT